MVKFSFIHAADLHLGSPFRSSARLDTDVAQVLRRSCYRALDQLTSLAISEHVRFVLFSGDIFDAKERNLKAQLHFRSCMKELRDHGIQVFVVHGNHDPLDHAANMVDLPDNCHIFPARGVSWQVVRQGEGPVAAVCGISFDKSHVEKNLAGMIPDCDHDCFRIAMLHCTVGQQSGHYPYAPCTLSDLTDRYGKRRVDYWALGHVHEMKILCHEPHVVYPGTVQGRSFAEQGKKGVLVVKVSADRQVDMVFHEVDHVRWQEIEIDAGAFTSLSEVMDAIWVAIEQVRNQVGGRPVIVRILLTGRSEISRPLGRSDRLSDMLEELQDALVAENPFIWIESIRNFTRTTIDVETRKRVGDLVGMILREAESMKEDPEFISRVEETLAPLLGNKRFRQYCRESFAPELSSLLDEAETLLLNRLE